MMLWHKKFRYPFTYLAVLFILVGASGFFYVASNGVKIFEVSQAKFKHERKIYLVYSIFRKQRLTFSINTGSVS